MDSLPRAALTNAGLSDAVISTIASLPTSLPADASKAVGAYTAAIGVIQELYAALEKVTAGEGSDAKQEKEEKATAGGGDAKNEKKEEKHHGQLHPALQAFELPKDRLTAAYEPLGELQATSIDNAEGEPDAAALRPAFTAAMEAFQQATSKEIWSQFGGAAGQTDRSTVCNLAEVMDAGNARFLAIYREVQEGFKSVDPKAHADFVALAASVKRACKEAKHVCRQSSEDALEILLAAKKLGLEFEALLARVAGACKSKAAHKGGPLKKLYRFVEKSALRQENFKSVSKEGGIEIDYRFGRVCDVRRGFIESGTMSGVTEILKGVLAEEKAGTIVVVRIKDRFSDPSAGGWSDCMVNLYFASDPQKHICEIQIVHKELMIARANLGGHDVYGKCRAAAELLELAALATPFYREIGLMLHQSSVKLANPPPSEQALRQFGGWRLSADVLSWDNVVSAPVAAGGDESAAGAGSEKVLDPWATLQRVGSISAASLSALTLFGGPWEQSCPLRVLCRLERDAATMALFAKKSGSLFGLLTHVTLSKFDDALLAAIGGCCGALEVMECNASSCTATDAGVVALVSGTPKLRILDLKFDDNVALSNASPAAIGRHCPELTVLRLGQAKPNEALTDDGAAALAQCPKLEVLEISNWDVGLGDASKAYAALGGACSRLRAFEHRIADEIGQPFPHQNVRDGVFASLVAPNAATLVELNMYSNYVIGDESMATLAACSQLRAFDATANLNITDKGIEALAAGCPKLEALFLSYMTNTPDYQALTGVGDARTDAALAALGKHCAHLESLYCCGWGATDAGVAALAAGCTKLRFANLQQLNMSDVGLTALAESCPALECLNLTGTAVSTAGMAALGKCAKLKALTMNYLESLTDESVAALLAGPASKSLYYINAAESCPALTGKSAELLKRHPRISATIAGQMLNFEDIEHSPSPSPSYAEKISNAWEHMPSLGCQQY